MKRWNCICKIEKIGFETFENRSRSLRKKFSIDKIPPHTFNIKIFERIPLRIFNSVSDCTSIGDNQRLLTSEPAMILYPLHQGYRHKNEGKYGACNFDDRADYGSITGPRYCLSILSNWLTCLEGPNSYAFDPPSFSLFFFFSEKNPPSLPIFSTSISNLISIYKRLFHFIIYIGLLYLTFIHWNDQLIIVETGLYLE